MKTAKHTDILRFFNLKLQSAMEEIAATMEVPAADLTIGEAYQIGRRVQSTWSQLDRQSRNLQNEIDESGH